MVDVQKGDLLENPDFFQIFLDDIDNLHVIFCGDTNDHSTKPRANYWNGFNPFGESRIPELQNIRVSTRLQPPPSCCIVDGSIDLTKQQNYEVYGSGDYILNSNNLDIVDANYIYYEDITQKPLDFPSSDHAPMAATLAIPNAESSYSGGGKKSKKQKIAKGSNYKSNRRNRKSNRSNRKSKKHRYRCIGSSKKIYK